MKVVLGTYAGYSTLPVILETAGKVLGAVEYPPLPFLRDVVDFGPSAGKLVVANMLSAGLGKRRLILHGPYAPLCEPEEGVCKPIRHFEAMAKAVHEAEESAKQNGLPDVVFNTHAPYRGHGNPEAVKAYGKVLSRFAETAKPGKVTAEPQYFPDAFTTYDISQAIAEYRILNAGFAIQLENEFLRDFWQYLIDQHIPIGKFEREMKEYTGETPEEYWSRKFDYFFRQAVALRMPQRGVPLTFRYALITTGAVFGMGFPFKKRVPPTWLRTRPDYVGPSPKPILKALADNADMYDEIYFIWTGIGILHHDRHYDYQADARIRAMVLLDLARGFEKYGLKVWQAY